MKESKNGFWVSWNGNLKHSFNSLLEVTNEKELSSIIEGSDSVRFFGNKQSSSDIAAGKSTLIDMRKMNKVLLVDTANKRITIQAGAPLELLIKIAEENNWCIPCLPDINTITIGGAIATGTHGTNGKLLSEYIHSCKMITADGKITLIDENHKLFGAVKVSFGSLGVISEFTFQCEDIFYLHLKEGPEKDTKWLNNFRSELKTYDFLRILWLPHTNHGYSIKGKKVSQEFKVKEKSGPKFLKYRRAASKFLYQYTHKSPRFTVLANKLLFLGFFTSKKEHVGSLYQATVTKSRGSTLELAEWSIDIDSFPKVFKELKKTINSWKNNSFIHIPMDIRFVKKDTSWLSYAYEKDIVTMGCVCRNASTADEYEAFKTVENIFIKNGGRPHWGKRFMAKDKEFSELYPKWNDFKTIRNQLDPSNKFLNPYLKSLFNE
jgi:L-gulonolactone oxidase